MPISPLAVAMMGGGSGAGGDAALLSMDPAILTAQPQLQLAQGMEQQGMSSAPAYPGAAIARALQGAIGATLHKGALSDLAQAYATVPDAAAQALIQGGQANNPAIAMLRSPNPMVRMMGLQMLQKTVPIQSEYQRSGPGTDISVGGTRVYQNQNPQSEVGKTGNDLQQNPLAGPLAAQAAAQRAGAEAKARSPYEAGGEGVVNTLNGPKKIPLTADTRAKMQPQDAVPAVAIPSPQAPQPGEKVQERAPQGNAIPGQPPVTGEPLPNPAIEPLVKADTEELKADREKALAGQPDMANVRLIQDFLPKVQTGWSAETKLEAGRILNGIGVSQDKIKDFLGTDVAAGQILQKKFVELSAAAARTMGAREPGSVISMFAKAYPNLGTVPEAVTLQTNALYMDRQRQMDLANAKTNYLNESVGGVQSTGKYRGLNGFNEQFNKTNPPEAYLSAAEAMSGHREAWGRATSPQLQNQITGLMPPNTKYLAPDGKWHMTPGGGQ